VLEKAMKEMLLDEKASAALWRDFEELVLKHTAEWLFRKKFLKKLWNFYDAPWNFKNYHVLYAIGSMTSIISGNFKRAEVSGCLC
jgi:hypothetical protein